MQSCLLPVPPEAKRLHLYVALHVQRFSSKVDPFSEALAVVFPDVEDSDVLFA